MAKSFFQDMVKYGKKARESFSEEQVEKRGDSDPKSKNAIWFVAGVSVIFFFFALSFFFSCATVSVLPKTKNLDINLSLTASKSSPSEGGLAFELVVIKGEDTKAIPSNSQKYSESAATGSVIIYNKGTSAQALVAETRLLGSNNKVYKLNARALVPASTASSPGSVEVQVHAGEGGEDYNSGPLDFTIMGFKGTSKYDQFYARSKGDISGGIKGQLYTVSSADRSKALEELNLSLKEKLFKKAQEETPKGFIFYKNAAFLETENSPTLISSKEADVPVTLKGSLYGFLFNEKDLTVKILASALAKDSSTEDINLADIRNLSFSLSSKDPNLFDEAKRISFNLSGPAKAVWNIDATKLSLSLLGQRRADFKGILSSYSGIESADLSIKPIWRMSFPDKLENIKVIIRAE